MGKVIQSDVFNGQTMFLNWRGNHSSTSNGVLYDTGWSTNLAFQYATIIPPFKGCVNKVSIVNNPYGSYNTGPTGSSATLEVWLNGSFEDSDTVSYTAGTAGEVITFDFSENVQFNANDKIVLRFQANGLWRYMNVGILLKELA